MPATEASTGYGIILKAGNGGSPTETFADFGLEIKTIGAPGVSRSKQEATHMQSPDAHAEFVYGIKTTKDIAVTFNWVPANTASILVALNGGKKNWQIVFPDGTTATVAAAITNLDISGLTPDGNMEASATFSPTGKATWS